MLFPFCTPPYILRPKRECRSSVRETLLNPVTRGGRGFASAVGCSAAPIPCIELTHSIVTSLDSAVEGVDLTVISEDRLIKTQHTRHMLAVRVA